MKRQPEDTHTCWKRTKEENFLSKTVSNVQMLQETLHVKNQCLGSQRRHHGVESMLILLVLSMAMST